MCAQILQTHPGREVSHDEGVCGLREQGLAAKPGSADARRPMHVQANIAAGSKGRLTGMQADTGTHCPPLRPVIDSQGTLHCHGVPVDWSTLQGAREPADVPTTVWQHRRYWADGEPSAPQGHIGHDVDSHALLGARVTVAGRALELWRTVLTDETRFVDVHDQGRCPTRSVWPTAPSCW